MSYTKLKLAERLQRILYPKTTSDAKLDIQEAMQAISDSRDSYIKISLLRQKGDPLSPSNVAPSNWVSEFKGVEVKKEGKKYYSELPAGVISLPDDMGVYHVFFDGQEEDLFIPVTPAFRGMYRDSLAYMLEGQYAYYLLEDRIYYNQSMPEDCTVSMNLICESGDLSETDPFPVDGSCVNDILKMSLELMGIQKEIPEDVLTNNISE